MKKIFFMFMLTLLFSAFLLLTSCAKNKADNPTELQTITVSTYFDDVFLSESVNLFNQAQTDVSVSLNVYEPFNDGEDLNRDYAYYLSAQLMSGKADDIVILSSIAYYKYYDYLTDLTPYMQNSDFQMNDYHTAVFDALKTDGKLFMIPIDFSIDVFAFNAKYAGFFGAPNGVSFEACADIGKTLLGENDDVEFLYGLDGFQMFFWEMQNNYDAFFDLGNKANPFNKTEFADTLLTYKALEENGYIPSVASFFEGVVPDNPLVQYDSVSNMELMLGYDKNFTDAAVITGNNGNGVCYNSYLMFGINSASKNKDISWEFIQYLISEERQASPQLSALPVNKNALFESAKLKIEALNQIRKDEGEPINEDVDGLTRTYTEKINNWAKLVRRYSYFEPFITDSVFEEGQNFFMGNKPASAVADVIENKLRLYLNE